MRFVKKTVNFDDPGTYHFYYGSTTAMKPATPGTILTFFPWEHAGPGRGGVGQTQQTAFRVPVRSLGYWTHRFVFRREGDDVRRRANELADFIDEARKRHGIGAPVALGYSNGANIAAAASLLLRAMLPLSRRANRC